MLPTLEQFNITTPVFIRKVNNRNHWKPEGYDNNLDGRAKIVSERFFEERLSSIWKVTLDEEFYGIIASLSANRSHKAQAIDFIWITQEELKEVNIEPQLEPEGKCLYVKDLHFNIQMDSSLAQNLCHILFLKDREPKRCTKDYVQHILNHQQSKNCKASNETPLNCVCQTS